MEDIPRHRAIHRAHRHRAQQVEYDFYRKRHAHQRNVALRPYILLLFCLKIRWFTVIFTVLINISIHKMSLTFK